MTPPSFHHLVDEYLNARRGLGFDLETDEWFLRDFARHAERIGHSGPVTIELAVQWALYSRSTNPAQAARRLTIVRQFARYRALIDPATEVPPVGLLGRDSRRRSTPHIYTEAEVAALLQQARCLLPRGGLRPATYVAFFALLASTGLRLSEARRLTADDADLVNGILTIRETKFRKSRLVPLHPTTTRALRRYADRRDACLAAPRSAYFFRTEHSPRLTRAVVEATFRGGTGGARMALRRELTARNVSFAYDSEAGRPALAGVDLTVAAGTFVAVAGPSGAGKSTLVDVLLGLIEPDTGEVRIDGRRLAGPDLRRWRRSVAYVPQDPHLFNDTIRANLRWARPEATEAELWRALRLAAAADFVAALPEGLDTVAADRGARFSGGERQRIVLARALLREPALLLLDEATGQLDAATEERVARALRSLRDRTTIVAVAHRPGLMEAADRIVVLEAGRVAATGDWRELGPGLTAMDDAAR